MSIPFNATLTGTFTSNGTSQSVNVPADIVKFELFNETQFGSAASTSPMIRAQWIEDLADGAAYLDAKTSGAATIQITQMITSNGFSLNIPGVTPALGPIKTGTSITQAAPAVVTINGHGYNTGDTVRVFNTTGMLQIASMEFAVTKLSANTFSLTNLDSSGFAAAATNVQATKINAFATYYPVGNYVTNISQAMNARITLADETNIQVGEIVRIAVPSQFGMTQMDGISATVIAVGNTDASGFTDTIDINVDSRSFTPFSFPTSAIAAAGISFPTCVPIGETASVPYANLLSDATRNTLSAQMTCGSSVVGGNNDVVRWIAYRALGN